MVKHKQNHANVIKVWPLRRENLVLYMAFFASILQGGLLVMLDDSDTFPVCVCHCQSILNSKKKFMKLEERHKKISLRFFSMKTV